MASVRSPARSKFGSGVGVELPTRQSAFADHDEGLAKSPMRERFLNDLGPVPNAPLMSSHVGSSPVRERDSSDFDFGGVGESSLRPRNVNHSPLRERGASRPAMSLRSRNVTRSPLREERTYAVLDDSGKLPARSVNGDIPKSPMRGDNVSGSDENVGAEQQGTMGDHSLEGEMSDRKMVPSTTFNSWLPADKHIAQSDGNYSGGRRTWRDRISRVDQISEVRESVYGYERGGVPEVSVDNLSLGTVPSKEQMRRDCRFRGGYDGGYAKPRDTSKRDGTSKVIVEQERISASSTAAAARHLGDPTNPIYGYGDPAECTFETFRGPSRIQDLEQERAELLWKYKELKDKLSNLDDYRLSSPGFYSGSDDNSEDESLRLRRGHVQQFVPDKNVQRPRNFNHGPVPVHHMPDKYNFPPPLHDDPFSNQIMRPYRPDQLPQFLKRSAPPHSLEQFDQDLLESYHDKARYHHPACSCSLCCFNDWQGQDLPNSLTSGMSANFVANRRYSRGMDIERHGPPAYNPRMTQPTPQEPAFHFTDRHPRRVLVTNQNTRVCRPISGGAPFVLCTKCFRLLKLPKKLAARQKDHYQLQCGACSSVMIFDLQNISSGFPPLNKPDSVDAASGIDEVLEKSSPKHQRDSCTATSTNLGFYDFDSVGYILQSMGSETSEVSKGQRSGIGAADSIHRHSSSSSCSSKDHISDNASVQSSQPGSADMPLNINLIRPPPGSPLRDHFDYSTHFRKIEAGELTSYSEEVKQMTEKDTSSESSVENTAFSGETEVHSKEVPATNLFQNLKDVLREEDKIGNNKDRKSSMPNFIKWGKVDHGSTGRADVCVNGQLIQHRLIKKAEKLAGSIQPGDYWYDSKAGFWGVMDHHCLGIIPPFIQEFNFPMPMNCSAGDTAVYVNGRELHQRDLDLLTSRGLPTTRNKSYIIDITGKALDEDIKEVVANLGKLAPTVERKKRGFGMKVPELLGLSDEGC